MDRAFRIMLVGLRISKIGQYAVSHVLRDVPAVAGTGIA